MITVITYNTHNYHDEGQGGLKTKWTYFYMFHGGLLGGGNILKHLIDHAHKGNLGEKKLPHLAATSFFFSSTQYKLSGPRYINSLMIRSEELLMLIIRCNCCFRVQNHSCS